MLKNTVLKAILYVGVLLLNPWLSCNPQGQDQETAPVAPFIWENATIYFLLTDRFSNGDPTNDINFDRTGQTALLRGFEGGDMAGIIGKIEEGYFDSLGISALWMTPWFEQVHGSTDEGTGTTYGYHGYWAKDWTAIDPNFGTSEELALLVETAHAHGIRIIMDVVINHTGPVTGVDPAWPDEWVRKSPRCIYENYETTVPCTLVENLPDIRTESDQTVALPPFLMEKWEREGRLEQEMAELDAFFERTGYPRAPRYYIIKWLTDYVRRYGIDGYRLDTAKHTEEGVWKDLYGEAAAAFREWKHENPDRVLDDNEFYMVGEVYGYGISSGRVFNYGDRKVDFFAQSIQGLINFEFKYSARGNYEALYSDYSEKLATTLAGCGILNYLSSHDDGDPFDADRQRPFEAATKLLLAPGACQIYYGDESCRELIITGAKGDANLRGPMNWDEIEENASRNGYTIGEVLQHYQKLGHFRRDHPAVGAGRHFLISREPYLFTRQYSKGSYEDRILVGLDLNKGKKVIPVGKTFENGVWLFDYYSGTRARVRNGKIFIDTPQNIVLLGLK
jgi:alpha-amylase